MNENITAFIQEEILNNKGNVEIAPDDDLLTSGLLDSLAIMKLIQHIEKSYNLTIPPEDMTIENFISIEAMEEYLTTRKSA